MEPEKNPKYKSALKRALGLASEIVEVIDDKPTSEVLIALALTTADAIMYTANKGFRKKSFDAYVALLTNTFLEKQRELNDASGKNTVGS